MLPSEMKTQSPDTSPEAERVLFELFAALRRAVAAFEQLGVDYYVGGLMAVRFCAFAIRTPHPGQSLQIDPAPVRSFLEKEKIASLEQLKQVLRTTGTMTVFRKLRALGYRSSYSHRGKFYTLQEIPQFDDQGLWSFHSVWFPQYGNLRETAREFVEESQEELDDRLHVECKAALLKLYHQQRLERERREGLYVYFSLGAAKQQAQRLAREEHPPGIPGQGEEAMAPEHKAALVLFVSFSTGPRRANPSCRLANRSSVSMPRRTLVPRDKPMHALTRETPFRRRSS